MVSKSPIRRWREPLVTKWKCDTISDVKFGIEAEAGMGIVTFDLELAGMAVIRVLRRTVGDCYENFC